MDSGVGSDGSASAKALVDWRSSTDLSENCRISSAEAEEIGASAPPPQALSVTTAVRAASRCVVTKTFFALGGEALVGFISIIQNIMGISNGGGQNGFDGSAGLRFVGTIGSRL
jgi:hypothetical protein